MGSEVVAGRPSHSLTWPWHVGLLWEMGPGAWAEGSHSEPALQPLLVIICQTFFNSATASGSGVRCPTARSGGAGGEGVLFGFAKVVLAGCLGLTVAFAAVFFGTFSTLKT